MGADGAELEAVVSQQGAAPTDWVQSSVQQTSANEFCLGKGLASQGIVPPRWSDAAAVDEWLEQVQKSRVSSSLMLRSTLLGVLSALACSCESNSLCTVVLGILQKDCAVD